MDPIRIKAVGRRIRLCADLTPWSDNDGGGISPRPLAVDQDHPASNSVGDGGTIVARRIVGISIYKS